MGDTHILPVDHFSFLFRFDLTCRLCPPFLSSFYLITYFSVSFSVLFLSLLSFFISRLRYASLDIRLTVDCGPFFFHFVSPCSRVDSFSFSYTTWESVHSIRGLPGVM